MRVDVLYHWSPRENRTSILQVGLLVMRGPETNVSAPFPWICLSSRPSRAWSLSGGMRDARDLSEEIWDLWEVRIPDGAEFHPHPRWGGEINEFRVFSSIPADHVWWVAERMMFAHDEVPPAGATVGD